jgi:uncharacterized protein YjhX (UPF0386 family)
MTSLREERSESRTLHVLAVRGNEEEMAEETEKVATEKCGVLDISERNVSRKSKIPALRFC